MSSSSSRYKYLPYVGGSIAFCTIGLSYGFASREWDFSTQGLPFISSTARTMPSRVIFAIGLSLTAILYGWLSLRVLYASRVLLRWTMSLDVLPILSIQKKICLCCWSRGFSIASSCGLFVLAVAVDTGEQELQSVIHRIGAFVFFMCAVAACVLQYLAFRNMHQVWKKFASDRIEAGEWSRNPLNKIGSRSEFWLRWRIVCVIAGTVFGAIMIILWLALAGRGAERYLPRISQYLGIIMIFLFVTSLTFELKYDEHMFPAHFPTDYSQKIESSSPVLQVDSMLHLNSPPV